MTPTTVAGKGLVDDEMNERMLLAIGQAAQMSEDEFAAAVLAIEAEAREDEFDKGWAKGKAWGETQLAKRIVGRLRNQSIPPRLFALSAWDLECVLAIVEEEAAR